MVVEAFITAPLAELTFTVGQPLGYTVNIYLRFISKNIYEVTKNLYIKDVFHIGEISYTFESENAFGCSDLTLWNGEGTDSLSGVSNAKYTLKHPGLFNTDGNIFLEHFIF